MNVSIKFDKVYDCYDDVVVFLVKGRKITLSKNDFTSLENRTIVIDYQLAKKHNLNWRLQYHIPTYIKPRYNQECIDELKYRAK